MSEFLEGEKGKLEDLLKILRTEVVIPAKQKNYSAKEVLKDLEKLQIPLLKKIK